MQQLLRKILAAFDQQPVLSARLMRELIEADRGAFQAAARSVLRQVADNRGYRYLIALLAGNNLLANCARDPSLHMTAALTLARIGIQVDPRLDTALANSLGELLADGQHGEAEAMRALQLLGEISDGPRLLPWLTNALRDSNPRIRSKVALLIGRRNENTRWVEQHKDDTDARVRANAIEGLWGAGNEGARSALWEASRDPNNRVEGNALLGLYRLGDTSVIERILAMSSHAEGRFRATAAWIMGESSHPRFLGVLGRMLADSDGLVRTRAFRALAKVRRRAATLEQAKGLHVHLWQARRLADGERRLAVASVDNDGALAMLPGTEFMISEGGHTVTAYEVRRRPRPPLLAAGFALPRAAGADPPSFERALREMLRYKKQDQSWAIARYSMERPEAESSADAPRFSTKTEVLEESLKRCVLRADAAGGLLGAARLLLASAVLLQGERHVVILGLPHSPAGAEKELQGVADTARYHGVAIQGVSMGGGGLEALRVLCGATGGRLLEAADSDQAQAALWRIFWGMQYQDEVYYRVEPGAGGPAVARVQVWSDLGMAEDSLALV